MGKPLGIQQVTWGHNIIPNTQTYTKSIKNARFPTFQLDDHGPTDRRTNGRTDRRTEPLIELRVRN